MESIFCVTRRPHLLAYAVKQLFPDAQVTIGPVIENGFYYDFSYKRPFTPEDLQAIEKKMTELARKNETVIRKVLPRDEAVAYFKSIGEDYKAEIIESIPQNEEVSLYTSGDFTDLCRGPHVPANGKLKVFKLMRVAGAYWRVTPKMKCFSVFMALPGRRRKIRMLIFTCLKKPKNVITVVWGVLLICSIFRMKLPDLFSGTLRDGRSGSKSNNICSKVYRDNGYQEVKGPQILDVPCGKNRGTGTITRKTCLRRSRKIVFMPSSR